MPGGPILSQEDEEMMGGILRQAEGQSDAVNAGFFSIDAE